MNIRQETRGAATLFHVDGRLDSSTAGGLEQPLLARIPERGTIVVDLGQVRYVSSAGLRVFLRAAKAAKGSNARLVLTGLSDDVREVFDISGFTALFAISPSIDEALAAG